MSNNLSNLFNNCTCVTEVGDAIVSHVEDMVKAGYAAKTDTKDGINYFDFTNATQFVNQLSEKSFDNLCEIIKKSVCAKASMPRIISFLGNEEDAQDILTNLIEIYNEVEEAGKEAAKSVNGGKTASEMVKEGCKITDITNYVNNVIKSICTKTIDTSMRAGETAEEYAARMDKLISDLKEEVGSLAETISHVTGWYGFKEAICSIVYTELDGVKTRRGIIEAGKRCVEVFDEWLAKVNTAADEEKFGDAVALRYKTPDDIGDNKSGIRSIFTAAFNAIAWIGRKSVRKLREWGIYETDAKKNIFGAIGAAVSSVFGIAGGIIKSVINVVVEAVKIIAGNIFGAILTAIAWVLDTITGWAKTAYKKVTAGQSSMDTINDSINQEHEEWLMDENPDDILEDGDNDEILQEDEVDAEEAPVVKNTYEKAKPIKVSFIKNGKKVTKTIVAIGEVVKNGEVIAYFTKDAQYTLC